MYISYHTCNRTCVEISLSICSHWEIQFLVEKLFLLVEGCIVMICYFWMDIESRIHFTQDIKYF